MEIRELHSLNQGAMMQINKLIQPSVGADLSRTQPIYRPGERSDGPLADKSAVRQSIVRLRVLPTLLSKNHNCAPTKVHPYTHLELDGVAMRYTIVSETNHSVIDKNTILPASLRKGRIVNGRVYR